MFSWRLWMTFTWKIWLSYPVKTCIKKRAQMEWLGHGSCGSKMDDMGIFSTGDRGESQNLEQCFFSNIRSGCHVFCQTRSHQIHQIINLQPWNWRAGTSKSFDFPNVHPFPGVQTNRFPAVRSFRGCKFQASPLPNRALYIPFTVAET